LYLSVGEISPAAAMTTIGGGVAMAQIYLPDDESNPFIYLMDSVSLNAVR
jgi:hypothetical protein